VKRISISVLILCVCFVSVAWGQQPAATCSNNWSEFHRTNMKRWNPCEKVLNVNNVGNLLIALGEAIKIYKLDDYSGIAAFKRPPFLKHD
jgi:hypothetical protein